MRVPRMVIGLVFSSWHVAMLLTIILLTCSIGPWTCTPETPHILQSIPCQLSGLVCKYWPVTFIVRLNCIWYVRLRSCQCQIVFSLTLPAQIIIYGGSILVSQRCMTRESRKRPRINTRYDPVCTIHTPFSVDSHNLLLRIYRIYLVSIQSKSLSYNISKVALTILQATRDPFYLDVGQRVLYDLTTRAKVKCGLAGIQDLRTNKRDDRMESFALSETLKVGLSIS